MTERTARARCQIVPGYVLARLADRPDASAAARRSLVLDAGRREARARRTVAPVVERVAPTTAVAGTGPDRLVSDSAGTEQLPGEPVRAEGAAATGDPAVDEAYDGLGATWRYFSQVHERDSVDGLGLPLLATVHYGRAYSNAFWDGTRMVFGDGDGQYFTRMTASLDVIGHELAHGVTEATASLVYRDQSGALNESVSDVFGSLVRQYAAGQSAAEADWLIGAGLFTDRVQGVALRSMKAPGTAYDDPVIGTDPQPASMSDFVETTDDNGGVHVNSGIPNRAFHLAATGVGGNAWEGAGLVWYAVLTSGSVPVDCDFATFADLTSAEAVRRWGEGSAQAAAVSGAWVQVGVRSGRPPSGPAAPSARRVVHVVRSGGLAGLRVERDVDVDDLPADEASAWRGVLESPRLRQLDPGPPQPDRYVYRVSWPPAGLDLTAGEADLPPDLRGLIDRSLGT